MPLLLAEGVAELKKPGEKEKERREAIGRAFSKLEQGDLGAVARELTEFQEGRPFVERFVSTGDSI